MIRLSGEFMDTSKKLRDIFDWNPARTGNYVEDCEVGEVAACQVISILRESECPSLLGNFVQHIVRSEDWGGFEVGFMHVIAQAARGAI